MHEKMLANINQWMALATSAFQIAMAMRNTFAQLNPEPPLPSTRQLAEQLITQAKLGQAETQDLKAWLDTLE